MSFHTELLVESLGKTWRLVDSFNFYYEKADIRIDVTVPADFITDFASTPRLLYAIFPPVGIYNKAAVLHDYLYDNSCTLSIKRKHADLFLLQAMEVLGVSRSTRYAMYFAVRLFGGKHFRKK